MEDLLSRLENIQQLVSLLSSEDRIFFCENIKDEIRAMCELTDGIEKELQKLPLDPHLVEEKNEEFYRQKIIAKAIFAHYWSLITFLNGKDLKSLKELDKLKNIVNNNSA